MKKIKNIVRKNWIKANKIQKTNFILSIIALGIAITSLIMRLLKLKG